MMNICGESPGMQSPCFSRESDPDSRVRKFRIPDSDSDSRTYNDRVQCT